VPVANQIRRMVETSREAVALCGASLLSDAFAPVCTKLKPGLNDGEARRGSGVNERFLIHVLPKGFHRMRHYGLFAKGSCADNIARARELSPFQNLKASPPLPPPIKASPSVPAAAVA
jgi:hypothetical protein